MKTSLLDYSKVILHKVSFCEILFEKELRKSIHSLSSQERINLYKWCRQHYREKYPSVIKKVFLEENVLPKIAGGVMRPIFYENTPGLF